MSNPTPYLKGYYKYYQRVKYGYESCDVCMNEMKLVKSSNGDYWICKVCNSTKPSY
jgi:hypothetical protein